jgi:hypothetical protein
MAEIRIDEACLDAAGLSHDERRRDRQQPAAIPLKPLKIDPELALGVLDLVADPEHEREGVSKIEVGPLSVASITPIAQKSSAIA